ncbi:hypothetical protein DFQ30_010692 [Apophysomyces sp. BC1015]|nr:hypothetical protein DFQ30_010692 [Apophysomyces sp. BC1015]
MNVINASATFSTEAFDDPAAAVERLSVIYDASSSSLHEAFERYRRGEMVEARIRACYPFVRLSTDVNTHIDSRHSYGFVAGPGVYETTVTRPDLFAGYYREQLRLLVKNHNASIEVGMSQQPIPIHFAFAEGIHLEGELDVERLRQMRDVFDTPDLSLLDASSTAHTSRRPTSLIRWRCLPRRGWIFRCTGCNYVLYTNYQFYIDQFVKLGRVLMAHTDDAHERAYRSEYVAFVEPGDVITYNANLGEQPREGLPVARMPQMPAYHLKRADGSGITMINIGVVRPKQRRSTTPSRCCRLGDYVLAHGYVREDHVLDADLPLWVPVPALAEVQVALERAVAQATRLDGAELKRVMRTGTVATTDNRNWELRDHREPVLRLSQSRAVALDMESATIAANGFRFRVPYGTLLCVSDKPLHGELKLPGMADQFYRAQVDQHLQIGVKAMELLRTNGLDRLHSRKLRSFAEVAFQ